MIIHGYPMRHNAGSEVYTQAVARALSDRHDVRVFTRREDVFAPAYEVLHESDAGDARVQLTVVNNPESRDRYQHEAIDAALAVELDAFKPDVVHVGHLNHLSTSMLKVIADRHIPIVFTLHDYWLMCPRGQFMQRTPTNGEPYPHCSGQEDRKCAERCYSIYFSGLPFQHSADVDHWSSWVHERMRHMREMAGLVDTFIAPSRHLLHRFRDEFAIPASRLHFLDYGFDLHRFAGRRRTKEKPFVFGYIGTHTPGKGIHQLLSAFAEVHGEPLLRIWGRPRDPFTSNLRSLAALLPNGTGHRIEWLGEYTNEQIVPDVFDHVDAVVVPSIWEENSPLVIHEAQQARVPVITADAGGMAEYVHHEVNGLLYEFRSPVALASQMQRLADDPSLARRLGERGYIRSADGNTPSMVEHVAELEAIYESLIKRSSSKTPSPRPGPWRITFDTNPDDCNLACIMCEEHSPFSTRQADRRAASKPKRRMDVTLIRRVLENSRGTPLREIIPSTMGEPLLYEHFDQIVDLCSEFGVRMNLTTNGTFPGLGATAWAQRIVPVTSDVKISINGATAATNEAVMIGSRWDSVLNNVRTLVQVRDAHAAAGGNRCRLTFQVTFLENNIGELPALVRLAAELGVDRVKGHHLWAHFTQIEGLSMRRSPAAIERWNRIVDAAHESAAAYPLANGNQVLLENIHHLDASAPDDIAPQGECPFLGQEAWVSAEGRFNPCCAPDELRRTLGEFGNLDQFQLSEIWTGPAYQRLRANYQEHRLCQTCNMRRPAR